MANRFVNPVPQFVDQNGDPLVGGTLTFYFTGTTSLKDTYSDESLTIPNVNPITLNSVGSSPVEVWLDDEYRIILKNATGTVVWDRDPVTGSAGGSGGSSIIVNTYADLIAFTTAESNEVVEMLGFYTPGDGGGGTFYWNESSILAADRGIIVQASGVTTGRFIRLYSGRINVRWYGAKGDGSTDDTIPIQSAQTASEASRGGVLFPSTSTLSYHITTAILFNDYLNWAGFGCTAGGQSTISGNLTTPLVYRNGVLVTLAAITGNPNIGTGASLHVRDIRFIQTNSTTGSCFQVYNMIAPVLFEACRFDFVFRGLELIQPFTSLVVNCIFSSSWFVTHPVSSVDYTDAVGLVGFQASAIGCDFSGCGVGARMYGPGVAMRSCRMEVCGIGLSVGGLSQSQGTFGTILQAQDAIFDSIQMEANEDNVRIKGMIHTRVSNITGGSTSNGPGTYDPARGNNGTGSYGLTIEGSDSFSIVDNIAMGGAFRKWAYNQINGGAQVSNLNMANAGGFGSNVITASDTRVMTPSPPNNNAAFYGMRAAINAVINNHVTALIDPSDQYGTFFGKLYLAGITQPDYTKPPVYPNNTCGTLAVSNGATTATHTFLTAQSAGNSAFNGALSSSADAGSTLAAGDYYVAVTLVGPRGETGVDISATVGSNGNYQKITLASTLRKITIPVFGADARLKHRAYIGTELGFFTGYIEFAGGTASLDYNGQALTGYGTPPPSGDTISTMAEKDTNYYLQVQPTWATTWYISAKATGSFTVTFGTAAPGAQTVGWLMYRP